MKRYTIAQLKAFISIGETGSFSATADALNVTQSTISLRISELEAILGLKLLKKAGRGTVLTEAGKVAKQYAEQAMACFEKMESALGASASAKPLRLGSIEAVALSGLPRIKKIFEQYPPHYQQTEFTVATGSNLLTLLAGRRIDLALLGEPIVGEDYWCEPLGELVTSWVASPATLRGVEKLDHSHLKNLKILTIQPPSRMHDIIQDWYARAKLPVPHLDYCTSLAFIVRFLAESDSVGVLPISIIKNELSAGVLRVIEAKDHLERLPIYIAGHSTCHKGDIREAIRALGDVIDLMRTRHS
ncbi:LysR family transcriptional regulator [Verticiella sediminum]|uniref:LysR family transcriptional regulator n=1 Tax=Verticiella sediminum TaxID=1247510 RepID=A0A556ABP9_9BURK|nr:LysR family transcriptional regulator [Verticiella sediminum]TSH90287.1 LysR family transcriptional regulator [Verticiella sediminum]